MVTVPSCSSSALLDQGKVGGRVEIMLSDGPLQLSHGHDFAPQVSPEDLSVLNEHRRLAFEEAL